MEFGNQFLKVAQLEYSFISEKGYLLDVQGTFGVSGTSNFSGDVTMDDDLTVGGTITAQKFATEFISGSIIYQSGSTKFGDTMDDVANFTGSLIVSGAVTSFTNKGGADIGGTVSVGTDGDKFLNVGGTTSKNSNVGSTSHGITIQDAEAPALSLWDTSDGLSRNTKIFLLGFSQGACLAMEFIIRQEFSLGGIIPIAGFIGKKDRFKNDLADGAQNTPVLLIHGSRDEMVLPTESEIAFELFSNAGFNVQLQTPSVGHKIPLQTKSKIEKFILETQ